MTKVIPAKTHAKFPSPNEIGEALRAAFLSVLCDLPNSHAARSQKWVETLADQLSQINPWDSAHLLHKIWNRPKRALDHGEFVTDIAIVEKVSTTGIQTRSGNKRKIKHQPEYVKLMLLAVESEFEPNSQHQLDDLSKLVIVNTPARIFVASRAGNGVQPKLESAQLGLFAEVIRDVQGELFILALMPHPRDWRMDMKVHEIKSLFYNKGNWIPC